MLHALPETMERRDRLGCNRTLVYLKTVMPIVVAAVLLAGVVAEVLLRFDLSGVRSLFAGIATLAVPHLLVAPWFEAHLPLSALLASPGIKARRVNA